VLQHSTIVFSDLDIAEAKMHQLAADAFAITKWDGQLQCRRP